MKYFCITILLLGCLSCSKYIEFKGNESTSKLVLNGIVRNDSMITVSVSNSLNILDNNDPQYLTNATVTVEAQGNLYSFVSHGNGIYSVPLRGESGTTYLISASHSDYKSVSATTTLLNETPIISWDTITVVNNGNSEFEMRLVFKDDGNAEDYYRLSVSGEIAWGAGQFYDVMFSSSDPALQMTKDEYSETALFNDQLFNGATKEIKIRINNHSGEYLRFRIHLAHCDKAYYNFNKSLELYQYSGSGDNPFSQPVQVYSNVENGRGIIGSANVFQLDIPL